MFPLLWWSLTASTRHYYIRYKDIRVCLMYLFSLNMFNYEVPMCCASNRKWQLCTLFYMVLFSSTISNINSEFGNTLYSYSINVHCNTMKFIKFKHRLCNKWNSAWSIFSSSTSCWEIMNTKTKSTHLGLLICDMCWAFVWLYISIRPYAASQHV